MLLWLLAMPVALAQSLQIRISEPADGAVIHAHGAADIALEASVTGTLSSYVTAVEYFVDGVSIGYGDGAPDHGFVWRNVAPGHYSIQAQVRAGIPLVPPGYVADSPPVRIEVRAPLVHPALDPNGPPCSSRRESRPASASSPSMSWTTGSRAQRCRGVSRQSASCAPRPLAARPTHPTTANSPRAPTARHGCGSRPAARAPTAWS
ncbi:MAG: hypothetical protein KIS89_08025 [Dokdonella sp.]|nr:hypothetical protein [Dokdonella sp.]